MFVCLYQCMREWEVEEDEEEEEKYREIESVCMCVCVSMRTKSEKCKTLNDHRCYFAFCACVRACVFPHSFVTFFSIQCKIWNHFVKTQIDVDILNDFVFFPRFQKEKLFFLSVFLFLFLCLINVYFSCVLRVMCLIVENQKKTQPNILSVSLFIFFQIHIFRYLAHEFVYAIRSYSMCLYVSCVVLPSLLTKTATTRTIHYK